MMARLRMAEEGTPMPSRAEPDDVLILMGVVEKVRDKDRPMRESEGCGGERICIAGLAVAAAVATVTATTRGRTERRKRKSIARQACVHCFLGQLGFKWP
jgi:hypothetical protein